MVLKVGYAPKEQYTRRGRQGPYTDVYSCAACLYAAITGFLPPESLERLDHDELITPSQAGVEITLYLESAVLKGLGVKQETRVQTRGGGLEAMGCREVVARGGRRRRRGMRDRRDFVGILQQGLSRADVLPADYDFEAHKELVPMQPGDVPVTYADTTALERDFGFKPSTPLREGLRKFAEWYKDFYCGGKERKRT